MLRGNSIPTFAVTVALSVAVACGGGGDGASDGGPTATPPAAQPASGPGSATYAYAFVNGNAYGSGADAFWIFEPAGAGSTPLPVVLFLHGYGALQPTLYRSWIDHIVLRGRIVVFPQYQADLLTPPSQFSTNVLGAVDAAIAELGNPGHAVRDSAKFAVVGHSYGGVLAANYAALAASAGDPVPQAVMPTFPGTGGFNTYASYASIAPGTLLLCVAGEDDTVVGSTDAKRIFDESTAVPLADKDFVLVHSDAHGSPPLVAEHGAPTSDPVANALDGYGVWKWFDALTDAAWYGTNRDVALGDTAAQRLMGLWSDGVPVVEPLVTDAP